MRLLLGLLISILAQDPCRWSISDGEIKLNGELIFAEYDRHKILYLGAGKLVIGDYRGTFWVNDYTEARRGLAIKDSSISEGKYLMVDFEDNVRMELSCFTNQVRVYG